MPYIVATLLTLVPICPLTPLLLAQRSVPVPEKRRVPLLFVQDPCAIWTVLAVSFSTMSQLELVFLTVFTAVVSVLLTEITALLGPERS